MTAPAPRILSSNRPAPKVGFVSLGCHKALADSERIARSAWDAPEIDGCVFLNGVEGLGPGDMVNVHIEHADEYDLRGSPIGRE